MNEQEFEQAFSDPKFVNMLLDLETGEEVRKALADKGIDLSPAELDKFAEVLLCALQKSKELRSEDMSKISGGVSAGFANIGEDIKKSLSDKGISLTQDESVKFNKIFARIIETEKVR